jgi:hypothetical protein
MIQQLSNKYQQASAALLLIICFNGMILPTYATGHFKNSFSSIYNATYNKGMAADKKTGNPDKLLLNPSKSVANKKLASLKKLRKIFSLGNKKNAPAIGGPSQPEMSAFKPVGTDNMVNLFTGDFSYNIPLMDVGGYPVNIFYDGGVGMEQEASWVGLGWNINPGNVNRNMRGIPDDFDGTDILKQTQTMKPNVTWGINLGADLEVVGIKNIFTGSIGASLGVSFNNYLGPALDVGIKGNTGINILGKILPEKCALTLGGSLSVNASSRSGVTFTPALSLTAKAATTNSNVGLGFGVKASTSYNSRTGIKAMQISEQMAMNLTTVKGSYDCYDYKTSGSSLNATLGSTSISFTKPSYIPSMRMPITNTAFSGHFQLGGALFGVYPSFEVEVYKQKSKVAVEDEEQKKPMVGYLYLQKAANNANAVMDFSRVNDNEVTPNTPVISAPQYAYDVFSIQGEGTGGSIRAYRNDEGYMRDNKSVSKDENVSAGADVGIPGHFGANFNTINTPSTIGEWGAGNKLRSTTGFKDAGSGWENVYFRNPGENSVVNPTQYDRIGGIDLVRYKLGGSNMVPTIEPILEKFSKTGELVNTIPYTAAIKDRKKRTQVTSFLTAEEASVIGLDKTIKSYNGTNVLNTEKNLDFQSFPRFDGVTRKKHHISQINVTEANGQRYVYGIPVYNTLQKDFTFTVNSPESITDPDKVNFDENEASENSTHLSVDAEKDGYVQITETPAYAHSFLLSGLLSPDYVDVTGDGITEDDLGNAVKFNYSKMAGLSKWRTPLTNNLLANFNGGKRTETKDDKGIISYGERESWYVHSIESKTMIALFKLENRNDSKGSVTQYSGINGSDNSAQRLKQIDLYSKADLKKNGIEGAKPIKTVHFQYGYTLCKNTPNNTTTGEGKLTLEKIWFTFNKQTRANKNQYVFSYENTAAENPNYTFNASDRWGTYKPSSANPQSLKNGDYPYSIQDKNQKAAIDQNAGAWMLKKILLPSGGQMEVTYESDDYAFVQNKRAAAMMQVVGFGTNSADITNQLYTVNSISIVENSYAFIKVPEACANTQEVFQKYLSGINQLSFKLAVQMPKGMEFIHSYATIDGNNYGLYTADATGTTIWVKLNLVDGLISPLSLTAIEFLREQLPGQAYTGYDVSDNTGLKQIGEMFQGWWDGIKGAFKDPVAFLRLQGKAQQVDVTRSFVRLNDPDGFKYGGGHRVKSIKLKDNWKQMNSGQLFTSEYGQDYDYTTTEIFNGTERTISSGVASYEPSLGGDENPFQTMIQVSNKVPLGPASYGAVEMPVLDAFFPAASVGYSKVTVKSIKKGPQDPSKKSRSGIGRQVTAFYTAKDFPVYYSNTFFDPSTDKQANISSFGAFFFKYAFDSRALSQGFLVENNDMHGKMKSQASYPENDDKTPINYTQNFYRNTGGLGFDEKFDFVYADQGGAIRKGNMGIDVELMTDTREFSVMGTSLEVQGQLDLFPVILPFWLPFIWSVSGQNENTYRAVTATKVVTYHSILDSVVVIDKGSQVSTKNLVFDAETGDVIVNRTNNEFKQPIYSTNYPAWWAYSGMGLAYKNIDAVYSGVNFNDGKVLNVNQNIFESGDELYVTKPGTGKPGCVPESDNPVKLWVFDKNKNNSSLTNTTPDYYFMDAYGKLFTKSGVSFKIIRSGKRNMLNASAGSIVSMASPIVNNKLKIDYTSKTINATAVEYKEKWQTDNDVIKKYRLEYPTPGPNLVVNNNFSNGFIGFTTGYVYSSTSPSSSGKVNIGTNPNAWNYIFYNCRDHTSGTGNMLMVDGATVPGPTFLPVWGESVSVQPNTDYIFSVWVISLYSINPSIIAVSINTNIISPVIQLNTNPSCNWQKLTYTWNSGSNNTASMIIRDNNNAGLGNDFALDDIYFGLGEDNCTLIPYEVVDCNGYFPKNINPYTSGLLGTFRTQQSKVFFGGRKESNPTSFTNITANGFLDDFKSYWDFNTANNLVPDVAATSKWVFQSEITKLNSKGLELETKDALNIYTAAQYGFNKTIPVAIASNSRYNEMFNEGFEDKDYNERLNVSSYNPCTKTHVDFNGIANISIVHSGDGINAHTGNTMLKINNNSQAVKTINFTTTDDNFDLKPLTVIKAGPQVDYGFQIQGTITEDGITRIVDHNPPGDFDNISWGMGTAPSGGSGNAYSIVNGSGDIYLNAYFDVVRDGNYLVQSNDNISITGSWWYPGGTDCSPQEYYPGYGSAEISLIKFQVFDVGNNLLYDNVDPQTYLYLDKGIYYIKKHVVCSYEADPAFWNSVQSCTGSAGDYGSAVGTYVNIGFSHNLLKLCPNDKISKYKSLAAGSSCSVTKAIQGGQSMLNPIFSPTPGKKMLFSAWVHENCGNATTPCTLQTYINSSININFSDGSSIAAPFVPTGSIIEGWQKIEGEFTIPNGATTADIRFINNNNAPMYVDDIRMHPYNANMKSYVYDPINLRLVAELDANNYASFYEYDEEGTLIRTKVETKEGIKTVTETRSAKQRSITTIQ